MGFFDFLGNNKSSEDRKNEKYLKEGTIYSCEVLPEFEEMLDRQEWNKALDFAFGNKYLNAMAEVFKPYFPSDCREVAEENRMKFINHVFYKYCKVYPNVEENAVAFLVGEFGNLTEVPVNEFVINGEFNRDAYEEDKEAFN